jgi:DNA-binding PadR family transcriptional regulator
MTTRALQEATLLVLTALSRGSQHGYGIITDVREISGGRVKLRAGTLYTALDRLRAAGLIGVDREEVADGRFRRYYRLAPSGGNRIPEPAARAQPDKDQRPELRIGDSERETAAAALGEHFAHGRLTLDELLARLEAALAATTQGEMVRITWDLPRLTVPASRLPGHV